MTDYKFNEDELAGTIAEDAIKWMKDNKLNFDVVHLESAARAPIASVGVHREQFEKTLHEEGLAAFLTKKEKRQLFH